MSQPSSGEQFSLEAFMADALRTGCPVAAAGLLISHASEVVTACAPELDASDEGLQTLAVAVSGLMGQVDNFETGRINRVNVSPALTVAADQHLRRRTGSWLTPARASVFAGMLVSPDPTAERQQVEREVFNRFRPTWLD